MNGFVLFIMAGAIGGYVGGAVTGWLRKVRD